MNRCITLCYAGRGGWFRPEPDREAFVGLIHIVWMIIVGFIVGVIARWIYPGAIGLGFWATSDRA